MFTFRNGKGTKSDSKGIVHSEAFTHGRGQNKVTGVSIHQTFRKMPCDYGIAAKHSVNIRGLLNLVMINDSLKVILNDLRDPK